MSFMKSVFRDSPAGQICRNFLGRQITPYHDELEGYDLAKSVSRTAVASKRASADLDEAEKSSIYDTDVEKSGQKESSEPLPPTGVVIVKYGGSEDKDNPQNWSSGKKIFTFFQICLLTFSIYSASAIITPAQPTFIKIFGISQQVSSLTLSMYVLGYGLGPLIFSPMSEMPTVGRNVAYMSTFFIFIVFTAIGSRVSNYPGLVVIRFLQGFFGGPVLATGGASAQDLFAFNKIPYALATWSMFGYLGPAVGPVISGFAVTLSTWRWSLYETLILSGFTFLLMFFCLPETNAEYYLTQRAARLRKKTGDDKYKTAAEVSEAGKQWGKLIAYHLTMPFRITILDPSILFINLYTALVYGIYYSFFESFPIVYLQTYNFSIGIMGAVFISVVIGAVLGLAVYIALVWFIYEPYTLKFGVGKPEFRLVPGIFASILAPGGMFIFGYAAKPDITWVAPTVGIALYAATSYVLVNVIFVYLPISYPRYAASIFAANGFLRSALACAAIHFSQPLFHNLKVGDGCAVLGSLAAACAPLFLGLWYAGPWLRSKSRFAESY